jgi:hypothetical protein
LILGQGVISSAPVSEGVGALEIVEVLKVVDGEIVVVVDIAGQSTLPPSLNCQAPLSELIPS